MSRRTPMFLTALALLFAAQLLRVFGPSAGWYLRDTVHVGTLTLAPIALGPFLLGLLAPLPARLLGPRRAWFLAGLGLALARLVEQLSSSPAVDLAAAALGLVFWLWLWPLLLGRDRDGFVAGIVLGLAADTSLKGLTGSLDLSWIGGAWPFVVVAALALLLVWALRAAAPGRADQAYPARALPLFAIGPMLLLHWLVLSNQGWVATLTGWSPPLAVAFILAGDIIALWWLGRATAGPRLWAALGPAAILLLASLAADRSGPIFVVGCFAGLAATGPLLAQLVIPPGSEGRLGRSSLALGLGNLLLVLLLLLYYLSLEIALPFGQAEMRLGVGLLVLLGALAAWRAEATPARSGAVRYALPLLIAPLALIVRDVVAGAPPAPAADGLPARVMTYNIHSGYGTAGRHNPEEIAAVISAAGADVVGFQEISRGAVLDGSTDLVAWFSRRLDMPYVAFIGTTDPVWGNAILSRYPLSDVERELLPRFDTLIGRGVVAARVDFGADDDLLFMSTHLHHRHPDLEAIHIAQLETILDLWAGRTRTVLVGDMNARPGWPQIELVLESGLVDSWAEAGAGDGYTANAAKPEHRIDWIFHTPDLVATEATVLESQASDHFAVVVTLDEAP